MNLPVDFCKRMKNLLKEEYNDFIASYQMSPATSLRINPLKGGGNPSLVKDTFRLSPVLWCKDGFYYEKEQRPGKHAYHEAGLYYIQEASAMAVAEALQAAPGDKVLDLCSAPGGKSSQIAAAMKGEGILVSNEIHTKRAGILSENIERLGIRNALVVNESPDRLAEFFPSYFDKILVDAPCSGEGMFRKDPKTVGEWSLGAVHNCALRQKEILKAADKMLKGGGRMVYSTCTFSPEEDEESIAEFLREHENYCLESPKNHAYFSEGISLRGSLESGDLKKSCRLWPHKLRGEGHFFAVLKKKREEEKTGRISLQKGVAIKECAEYTDFERSFLKIRFEGEKIYFGDRLYLLPKDCPDLKGLKVIRPGLHLGSRKKGRFEPSHALALALTREDVVYTSELSLESGEVNAYIEGQTLQREGEKGWHLLLVDGYSLAWGKLSNNSMKNHYPKGLRKNLKREECHA